MFQTFDEFLATSTVEISLVWICIDLLIVAILAQILGLIYQSYGNSLSNRKSFSQNFSLVAMATMLIITIVKSSLALSLGLVGALSIIRFRAAIKEPEELAYLFIVIAIGLGFGANQRSVTFLAFFIISLIIIFFKKSSKNNQVDQNLHLIISGKNKRKVNSEGIIKILKQNCESLKLTRFDENHENIEISFWIELEDYEQLLLIKKQLNEFDENLDFSFLDDKGVF